MGSHNRCRWLDRISGGTDAASSSRRQHPTAGSQGQQGCCGTLYEWLYQSGHMTCCSRSKVLLKWPRCTQHKHEAAATVTAASSLQPFAVFKTTSSTLAAAG